LKDKTEYFLDIGMDYDQIRQEKRKAWQLRNKKMREAAND